jgi:heat shock protein HslJ
VRTCGLAKKPATLDSSEIAGHNPCMRRVAVVLTVIAISALEACTNSSNSTTGTPNPSTTKSAVARITPNDVVGTWGADPKGDDSQDPWFRFHRNGEFGGSDGCNSVHGTWTLNSSTASISTDKIVSTLVRCSPGQHVSLSSMKIYGDWLTYKFEDGNRAQLARRRSGRTQDAVDELHRKVAKYAEETRRDSQ